MSPCAYKLQKMVTEQSRSKTYKIHIYMHPYICIHVYTYVPTYPRPGEGHRGGEKILDLLESLQT